MLHILCPGQGAYVLGKAASYNEQKYFPGKVLFWSFGVVSLPNRELGGVSHLGMVYSTH